MTAAGPIYELTAEVREVRHNLWSQEVCYIKKAIRRLTESADVGKELLYTEKVLHGEEVIWRWEDECLDGM